LYETTIDVTFIGEIRNEYKMFTGTPEGKKTLERPKRKCDNIKMDSSC
jgi:hypothetical protein